MERDLPNKRLNTKWTMEVMAGAVYAIKDSGMPVNAAYLQTNHPNLMQAIGGYPGGWKGVVEFAGFNPVEERKK